MILKKRHKSICAAVCLAFGVLPVRSDEGFWLYSQAPLDRISDRYAVRLTPEQLERMEKSTVRFNEIRMGAFVGGSGSFVSAKGLVLTNLHVVAKAASEIPNTENLDLRRDGFLARKMDEEIRIPGISLDVLLSSDDVTRSVLARTEGITSQPDAERVRRQAVNEIERSASDAPNVVAEVLTLNGGAQYMLYRHRRYTDVRLVFLPESAIAYRQGDYPAPCFDVAIVRAYEDDSPAHTERYLRLSDRRVADGEAVFVTGAPTRSRRHLTVAELEAQRDTELPPWFEAYSKLESRLARWGAHAKENFLSVEPTLRAIRFARQFIEDSLVSSRDSAFMDARQLQETRVENVLKERVDSQSLAAFQTIRDIETSHANVMLLGEIAPWGGDHGSLPWEGEVVTLPLGAELAGPLYSYGQALLRLHRERERPEQERVRGYRDSDRGELERWLLRAQVIDRDVETVRFATYLEVLSESLGPDHPIAHALLAGKPPAARAAELVGATRLGEAEFRRTLYEADNRAFDLVSDPFLDMLRALEHEHRRVGAASEAAKASLAEAQSIALRATSSIIGQAVYPDATRTARLSYGAISGYRENQIDVPSVSRIGSIYERREQARPGTNLLPRRWMEAKSRLNLSTPLNFLSTADIVAGNSGSATVDAKGRLIGIAFGPRSLRGSAAFDYAYGAGEPRRAAHVAASAVIEALLRVYDAPVLVRELAADVSN